MPERLGDLWIENVRRSPSALALVEGETGRIWSRADLAAAADAWRASLPAGTALTGRRVTFAEPNGAHWLSVFIGLLLEGAIAVPLDPAEPAAARVETARAAGASHAWERGSLRPVAPRRPARRADLCLVKLTSGSTGTPRALAFTHAQMIADGRHICSSMGIAPDDLNLGVIPFGHSYGLGNIVVPLLAQGTPVICAASPFPQSLAADCERWQPTIFPAVPTLLRALVRADVNRAALASLRLVISAGAPLPPEIANAFLEKFGRKIHSFYGSSETGGISFDRTGDAAVSARSVGTPLDGVTLQFGRGRKFWVESAAVTGRGRHSPSDRAELNAQGELVLLGRAGRTAKIAGRRIDLAEIEKLLLATPGVREAFAAPHPTRPDALAAVVAGDVDGAELRQRLRARVALWKIPERLIVLTELPRTSRGKVDRKQLEALLVSRD